MGSLWEVPDVGMINYYYREAALMISFMFWYMTWSLPISCRLVSLSEPLKKGGVVTNVLKPPFGFAKSRFTSVYEANGRRHEK
jgi:hypothetical protein